MEIKTNYEDLTIDELDRIIECILSGQKPIRIGESAILLRHPTNRDKVVAGHIYDTELERARKAGLLSYEELDEMLDRRGIYTEEDKFIVEDLNSQISAQKKLLPMYVVVKERRNKILANIEGLQERINKIESKRLPFIAYTDEYKAREAQQDYYTWVCSYDLYNDTPLWDLYEDYKNDKNYNFKRILGAHVSTFIRGMPIALIRYVARHSIWRARFGFIYKCGGGHGLFGRPPSEFTVDMLSLAHWSLYYQSVYEMMPEDVPSDDVIENDYALDAYMKELYAEKSRERSASTAQKKRKANSAYSHQEVIVTRSDPMYSDIDYSKQRLKHKIKDSETVAVSEKELVGKNKERLRKRRIGTAPDNVR